MTGMVLRLAMRNLARHKRRTTIVAAGIAIGVAAAVVHGGLAAGIRHQMIDHLIISRFGHVTVSPDFSDAPDEGAQPMISDPARIAQAIQEAIPRAQITPFLSTLGMAFGERAGTARVALNAIIPELEPALMNDLTQRAGGEPLQLAEGSVWLGGALAERLECGRGGIVTLGIFTSDGALDVADFEVAQVFGPGAPWQDYFVYMRLEDLQRLLGVGRAVGSLRLRLASGLDGAAAAVELLRPVLAGMDPALRAEPFDEAGQLFMGIIKAIRIQAGVVEATLLVAIALTVAGAQIVSVHERRREIGMMAALGTMRGSILTVFLVEGAVLALAAGSIGAVIGAGVTALLGATGLALDAEAFRWMVGAPTVVPRIEFVRVLATLAGLVLTVTVAGLTPALRASRLLPVEALKAGPA